MTSGFHLVFLLSLTGGLLISGAWSDCPRGWKTYGSHCYIAQTNPLSMPDAEAACVRLGGHLTSVHSLAEQNFVRGLIREKTGSNAVFWIGLTDSLKEGTFKWTDGSLVDYRRWFTGEPNNINGGEDCVEVNFQGNTWNDSRCRLSRAFVCARKK